MKNTSSQKDTTEKLLQGQLKKIWMFLKKIPLKTLDPFALNNKVYQTFMKIKMPILHKLFQVIEKTQLFYEVWTHWSLKVET